MPWPQVWPRRQKTPQQQIPTELALIEKVERTNMKMTIPQQRIGFRNPYAMNINRRENRNCYSHRGFEHITRNYRNKKTDMNRRIEQE